jgi:hypothetical protein
MPNGAQVSRGWGRLVSNWADAGAVAIRVSGEGGSGMAPSPSRALMCETAATPRPDQPFLDLSGVRSAAGIP